MKTETNQAEINKAIAECLGWTRFHHGGVSLVGVPPRYANEWGHFHDKRIPDFVNDLNAMRIAEKTLTFAESGLYERLLEALSAPEDGSCPPPSYGYEAHQRAKAFLYVSNPTKAKEIYGS